MDYHLRNNYIVEEKSKFNIALDWLSTPCRAVLGGRTINLLTGEEGREMTTAKKVAIAVLSIIFFPVAVISVFSFTLKAVIFPSHGERRVLDAWNKMNSAKKTFDDAFKENQYAVALRQVDKYPGLKAAKQKQLYQIGKVYLGKKSLNITSAFNKKYLDSFYTEKLIQDAIEYYLSNDPKQFAEVSLRVLINCNDLNNSQKIALIDQLLESFKPNETDEQKLKSAKSKVSGILINLRNSWK